MSELSYTTIVYYDQKHLNLFKFNPGNDKIIVRSVMYDGHIIGLHVRFHFNPCLAVLIVTTLAVMA